jgi:anti-sigma regulatory factor (Ser/Thr protein kinase)
VVDELVSNAVTHARGPSVEVSFQRVPGGVLAEVTDTDPSPPVPRQAMDLDDSGRGLHIVAALSATRGRRPEGQGKVVFAVVPEAAS